MINAKKIILDILFPPVCLGCFKNIEENLKEKQYLCDACLKLIVINSAFSCPVCRLRLADNKIICHHESAPRYILGAAANYDNPVINNLIHYFKYENFQNLAPFLSEFILEFLGRTGFVVSDFILIPIPLHSSRERQRGYNQSKLLAKILSDKLKIYLVDGLKRTKKTNPQARAKKIGDREKNVKDCFEVIGANQIKGKNILLVDDVFTSGATINEAVRVLRNFGARKIAAVVIARA